MLAVIGCVIVYKIGFKRGIEHRKQIAEAQFISAEEKAKAIVAEAERAMNPTRLRKLQKYSAKTLTPSAHIYSAQEKS